MIRSKERNSSSAIAYASQRAQRSPQSAGLPDALCKMLLSVAFSVFVSPCRVRPRALRPRSGLRFQPPLLECPPHPILIHSKLASTSLSAASTLSTSATAARASRYATPTFAPRSLCATAAKAAGLASVTNRDRNSRA